jgi:hypothetical protein
MAIRSLLFAVLASTSVALAVPAHAQELDAPKDCTVGDAASLEGRNCAFLRAVRKHGHPGGRHRVTEFLPRIGDLTYLTTIHDSLRILAQWRFPAGDWAPVLQGPLRWVFDTSVEEQPVGTLSHQLIFRGTAWRRVGRTLRFVPPDAADDSGLFVEWRREGDAWVVATIGDERFHRDPLPHWCC